MKRMIYILIVCIFSVILFSISNNVQINATESDYTKKLYLLFMIIQVL